MSSISRKRQNNRVWGEKRRSHRLESLIDMFREMFPVVPWTEDAARAYADVRAHLEESGKPIGDMKRRGQVPRNADFSGHLRSQPHRNAGAGWRNEITVRT